MESSAGGQFPDVPAPAAPNAPGVPVLRVPGVPALHAHFPTLEEELSIKQDELAQTKENLKQAKEDEKNQYEAMKLRIRFMYEKGDSAMLTSILESRSIADLLNRVEYVNQVYDYDRNLLTQYETSVLFTSDYNIILPG